MSEYIPSRLSAVFVPPSAFVSILIPGIYGAVLYIKFLHALTGIDPHGPLPRSFETWLIVMSMLVVMALGFVLGGIVWIILLNIILPSNAARYWARYPSPEVPILTPLFEKLSDWILSIRS